MNSNKLVARVMNLILASAIALALVGGMFMLAGKTGPATVSIDLLFTQLDSTLFFSLAVLIVLLTPLIISFTAAIAFLREKNNRMSFCALLLLAVLGITVIVEMAGIS